MNIPLHALVRCKDGDFGHTTCLIVNPITEAITHFVVNDRRIFGREHIVPVSFITTTTSDTVMVNCDRAALAHEPGFIEYEYDRLDDMMPYREDHVYWPIMVPEDLELQPLAQPPYAREMVAIETLGIRRNMAVYAAAENEDGERTAQVYFGKVKAFIADPCSGSITHLIVYKISLWGSHNAAIPVSDIRKIDMDEILLSLTDPEIDALPSINVKHPRASLIEMAGNQLIHVKS
jgi:uncharacterized protein YrrD